MSLATYREKRHFQKTPEPRGEKGSAQGALRFVVQKHRASRLHYDFRLELDGTLKSWAVPKGPSLNPADKRLAVMVEDHPLEYRAFEGTIPEGNYGAGTVMIWDEGTYCSRETADRHAGERALREGLKSGHLSFVLNGRKLRGEFALVKLKRGKDNEWLLIKKNDEWAGKSEVTKRERSVSSGRTLEEINNTSKTASRSGKSPKVHNGRMAKAAGAKLASKEVKRRKPGTIEPMLATLVEEPFDREGWFFEVKWDGYRAIAEIDEKGVSFYSRNHISFADRFGPLVEAIGSLGRDAVLDGEVVVLDEKGRSRFQLLQKYQRTGKGRLRYYVFDLLALDGRDLRDRPLRERKELLAELVGGHEDVLFSEHVEEEGVAFFEAAAKAGLEGIIAKDGDSPYRENQRGPRWLKIKTHGRQEAVIGGFTEPRGSRKDLGALVLGVYEGKELVYIGHTGGKLSARGLAALRAKLEPLARPDCPFSKKPKTNAPVHWVEPRLVCEVSFQEWTDDGHMRQPIFQGLREDKAARAVHREKPTERADAEEKPRPPAGRRRPRTRRTATPRAASSNGKAVRNSSAPVLTNLGKVYWPDEGYTKGDLLAYYRDIAPVILPYLRDRPQSLNRHPNGVVGKNFFQKNVAGKPLPPWLETVFVPAESGDGGITYALCQNEASLLYLANLGCIELNPWNSRVGSLENPDYAIIDLDPEAVSFDKVIEAAIAVRKELERAGIESACKTSGKRGLHIFVPLAPGYSTDQATRFAQLIATIVNRKLPATTSIVRSPARRQHRVYLDYLQNRRGQTLASAYSVRPYSGATVSTPLKWQEVGKALDPSAFTIKSMAKRLQKVGDLWKPVLSGGADLDACLSRLAMK